MTDNKEKLIVALDVADGASAHKILQKLKGYVSLVKIGLELYTREGRAIVEEAAKEGFRVFLDLKFHDIPNTVAKALEQVARLGVFMTNVHTLGGLEMMRAGKAALEKASPEGKSPLLIGVTVLTSHTQESFNKDLNVSGNLPDAVLRYAKLAKTAGLDGVVASPHEIQMIKKELGSSFKVVAPGVRPLWASAQDQKRVMTPKEAIQAGADFIVVGRPILEAKDPCEAAQKILDEMGVAQV